MTRKQILQKRAEYFREVYQQLRRDGKDHKTAANTAAHDAAVRFPFCRDVVGYDLAAFFERNSGRIKAELEAILQKLLEASP